MRHKERLRLQCQREHINQTPPLAPAVIPVIRAEAKNHAIHAQAAVVSVADRGSLRCQPLFLHVVVAVPGVADMRSKWLLQSQQPAPVLHPRQ